MHFNDIPELIGVFCDLVIAHKAMVGRHVLHGDLSPNNIIIYKGKGYFIDFDHAKFLNDDGKADASPRSTGTIPYISFHVLCLMGDGHLVQHTPCNDLELLFYILLEFTVMYLGPKGILAPQPSEEALQWDAIRRWGLTYKSITHDGLMTSSMWKREFIRGLTDLPLITPYFLPCQPLLDEWCQTISSASTQSMTLSHDQICDILTWGLDMVSKQDVNIPPPTSESASQSAATVAPSLPDPSLAVRRSCHSKQAPVKR
ncbi:hypothetical protein F4604DRAFT_1934743 [Suillus subluteus]|nr:hypothetical protein F4604DRAFT_1934743 [Suillus subluteus]